MDLENFISTFSVQFDETDPDEIRENTVFQDLEEWSSMTALSIIAFIRVSYGKVITAREIRSCTTVKDLFVLVESK